MSAITISRQMSSQGDELALQVAQHLGWRRIDRDLINTAAKAAGAPQVALAEIDELGLLDLRPTAEERQAYQSHIERFMRELADEGEVVIVGRGGQVVLRDLPHVFHIRVVAPLEQRVIWLQQQKNLSVEAARVCLEKSNSSRTHYLWQNYGVHLDDPTLYHIVVNTGLLGLPQAVNLVVQAFRAWTGS